MHGPHRAKLLEKGALSALLQAALTSVNDEECDMVVQQVRVHLRVCGGGVWPWRLQGGLRSCCGCGQLWCRCDGWRGD